MNDPLKPKPSIPVPPTGARPNPPIPTPPSVKRAMSGSDTAPKTDDLERTLEVFELIVRRAEAKMQKMQQMHGARPLTGTHALMILGKEVHVYIQERKNALQPPGKGQGVEHPPTQPNDPGKT